MRAASSPLLHRHIRRTFLCHRALLAGVGAMLLLVAGAGRSEAQGSQGMVQVRVVVAEAVQTMAADALRPVVELGTAASRSPSSAGAAGASGQVAGSYRVVVRRTVGGGQRRVWVRDLEGRERELGATEPIVVADNVSEATASALALRMRSEGGASAVELTYEVQARSGLSL